VNWIVDNVGLILELTAIHLQQSAIAIVLGFVLSVPLGWVAWRYQLVKGPVIVLTGLLYTIPSLALLILLPSVAGYPARSPINLIIGLTIYAVAILVRAVSDGLDSVDPAIRQSATAMGSAGSGPSTSRSPDPSCSPGCVWRPSARSPSPPSASWWV